MGQRALRVRLGGMMFLEYAVRGMWYPFLSSYLVAGRELGGLGFTTGQVGWVMAFGNALGAITAPWIAGQVADRYFNAEKALAAFHVLAAIGIILCAYAQNFVPFLALMVLFSVFYVPTQSLTNSLALTHLEDREHTYPRLRIWGTVGWVASGALFTYLVMTSPDKATNIARIPYALWAGAALGVVYAAYALAVLPATPPTRGTGKHLAVAEAFGLLRDRSVLVLTIIALPVAAIHTAYYVNIAPYLTDVVGVSSRNLGPVIGVSQTSEVVFLFALGPLLKRWGYKRVLALGAAAQAARFIVFAINPAAGWVIASLALHGVAFACFFTTAVLYIERASPPAIRHSAQTVFGIVLFGIGPALASPYSEFFDRFVVSGRPDFKVIWWTQFWVAAACVVGVVVFFRERGRGEVEGVAKAEAAETGVE